MKTKAVKRSSAGNVVSVRSVMRAAAMLCAIAVSLCADDTMITTGDYYGTLWGDGRLWTSGSAPTGAGITLDTGSGSPQIRMDETNRMAGRITSTFGTMPAEGGQFLFSVVNNGFRHTDTLAPQGIFGNNFHLTTNTFTFDNNGNDAQIRIEDGTGGNGGTARKPYRYLFDVPVVLADNLAIRHLFTGTNQYGSYTTSQGDGPAAGVIFSRKISGGGKGITIENTAATLGVIFMGDSEFTGDLTVNRGLARAKDTSNLPRVGTPFGQANSVIATNDEAGVDLGGFITGAGQTLRLKGKRTCLGGTNGVLFSTWARPGDLSEWQGNVILEGETWIGGTLTGNNWPANFYPIDTDGGLAISGPISEAGGSATLHVLNGRDTVFSGANTFSGGLYLDKGFFTARGAEAFGTGGIYFNGGIYRVTSAEDADIFTADVHGAAGGFRVFLDAGVTCTMASNAVSGLVKPAFYKYGPGTLVLTNRVSTGTSLCIMGGTVVLDTTREGNVKFGPNNNNWEMDHVYLYNDATFVVRGDPATVRTGAWYGTPQAGLSGTFRAEDGQRFNLAFNADNNLLGCVNLETDNSGAYFTGAGSAGSHTYNSDYAFLVYEGSSWVYTSGGRAVPLPDSAYQTTWGGKTDIVDVTPALAAVPVPASTEADVIRFNTPNGGAEIVLTLAGDLTLDGRTILVTPAMGNTPVRITGGAIKSSGLIRILNFNTNATLTIESDLAKNVANTQLITGGPGKTFLKGAKTFNGLVYVVGGELEVDCADALGTANAAWNSGYVFLSNGGVLSFNGVINPVLSAATRTEFSLRVSSTGGGLKVPDADDVLTLSENGINVCGGGLFRKTGAGTLELKNSAKMSTQDEGGYKPNFARTDFAEGTVIAATGFQEGAETMTVRNGVSLKGPRWIAPSQAGANGGGNRMELQAKRQLVAGAGGATVDLQGQNVSLADSRSFYGLDKSTEFFGGTGEIRVVNTSATEAKIQCYGYHDAAFRGKFTSHVPVTGEQGLGFRNAEWCVPEGVTNTFTQIAEDRFMLWFGRLSGKGTLTAQAIQTYIPGRFFLGQDDVPAADFEGTLGVYCGGNSIGALQLVKVGNNAQRISGAANTFEGHTIIRAGSLLVGNNSPATAGASGALGQAMVYVGDAETPAGASPALLADGAYTIANEIRVHDFSPASATPVLGGTANADGALFSGAVRLYRDVIFRAETGTTVTFTGEIEGLKGAGMSGGGRVVLADDVTLGGGFVWTGGTLQVNGAFTIPEGAALTVDASVCTKENRGTIFTLIRANGGIFGTFMFAQELPAGWRVATRAGAVCLLFDAGTTLFLK